MEETGVIIVLTWYDRIIIGAAVLTGLGVLWRYVVAPLWRTARLAEEAIPVLLSIAREFEANGGNTLKDDMNALGERMRAIEESQAAFQAYVHRRFHDVLNLFQVFRSSHELGGDMEGDMRELRNVRDRLDNGG